MTANDSKKRFVQALKSLAKNEPVENITTEEIVKTAGLSRQTFYKYFMDKYDLAFWCYRMGMDHVIESYRNQSISFHDMNVAMLNMMLGEKDFYRNLWAHFEVQNSFFRQYHRFSYEETVKYFGRLNKSDRALVDLYSFGCNLMIMQWVNNGMVEDVEFMATLFDRALPDFMQSLLEER